MEGIGVNLRVSTDSQQGGRKYMEDVLDWRFVRGNGKDRADLAYYAVYDGHGGPEAAKFAKCHLLDTILSQKGFWSNKDEEVKKAISAGFVAAHKLMWKERPNWNFTNSGFPSTAGTTASVCIIREQKLYVAHVGDSSVVLGFKSDCRTIGLDSHLITEDHKPESPAEKRRIERSGGMVANKSGVQRVVWHRPRNQHKGPIRRSTHIDHIPFLAVARALGDLWSYNSETDEFIVSPEPDISMYALDADQHKTIIIASDGLWNMVTPCESVDIVSKVENENKQQSHVPNFIPVNAAKVLVRTALKRWQWRMMRADNTSVIVLMIDPAGMKTESPRHISSTNSDLSNHSPLSDNEYDSFSTPVRNIFHPNQSILSPREQHFNAINSWHKNPRRSLDTSDPRKSSGAYSAPPKASNSILDPSDMLLNSIQKNNYVRILTARPREINGEQSCSEHSSNSEGLRTLRTITPRKLNGSLTNLNEPREATSAKSPVKKNLKFQDSPRPGTILLGQGDSSGSAKSVKSAVGESSQEMVVQSSAVESSSSSDAENDNQKANAPKTVLSVQKRGIKRKASPNSNVPNKKRASVRWSKNNVVTRRRSLRPHILPAKYQ